MNFGQIGRQTKPSEKWGWFCKNQIFLGRFVDILQLGTLKEIIQIGQTA